TPATMVPEAVGEVMEELISVPLVDLAFTRSGDKGDKGNVGIYPRDPRFLPFIWASLDETSIAKAFAHVLDDTSGVQTQIERFYLPGLPAMNILMRAALGGGGTGSLRTDPQGKGYSQIALAMPVQVPKALISAARAA
ncbi:MAG: terpene utilization protein AtuA, partial [Pseudomonadota bacterium]